MLVDPERSWVFLVLLLQAKVPYSLAIGSIRRFGYHVHEDYLDKGKDTLSAMSSTVRSFAKSELHE